MIDINYFIVKGVHEIMKYAEKQDTEKYSYEISIKHDIINKRTTIKLDFLSRKFPYEIHSMQNMFYDHEIINEAQPMNTINRSIIKLTDMWEYFKKHGKFP